MVLGDVPRASSESLVPLSLKARSKLTPFPPLHLQKSASRRNCRGPPSRKPVPSLFHFALLYGMLKSEYGLLSAILILNGYQAV
jgi:hypothetical protein